MLTTMSLALVFGFAEPAQPAFPGRATDTIAFWRVAGPGSGTHVVRADGTGERLFDRMGVAVWSPDGRRVAGGFLVGKRCVSGVVDLATGRGTKLRSGCGGFGVPAWSPDGKRLAYSASEKIFVVGTDGRTPPRRITSGLNDQTPSWSPDGRTLLFSMLQTNGPLTSRQIASMTPAGENVQPRVPFTHANDQNWGADWSPDGARIVFTGRRDEWMGFSAGEIYVMELQTGAVTRLTTNPGVDDMPSWSPDGTRIVFSRGSGRNGEIWVMNADGSGQRLVARDGLFPRWVPRGARTTLPPKIRFG